MMRVIILVQLLIAFFTLAPHGFAEEATSYDNGSQKNATPVLSEKIITAEKSWWKKILGELEENRDSTTQKYLSMSRSIDQYFYGKDLDKTSTKSHLKLELKNTFYTAGQMEQDIKLRGKIDLPNTKKRLKLVFTSSADLERSLEDRVTDNASGERINKDDSFAGIEFTPLREPTDWKTDFTAGIKLRAPLLPFAKYDLENQWELSELWTANFEQVFWYLDDDGFGETSEIRFNRPITKNYSLEISSELEFRDKENTFFYDLILSTTHRLTPVSSIEYYTGGIGASQPTNQITNYIIGASYRKLLHEDWLFLNLEPGISLPRDEGWKPQPSFTLRLQIYFSDQTK
jgi:hypothetical protein